MNQDFYFTVNQLLNQLDVAERIGDDEKAEELSRTLAIMNPIEEPCYGYELLPTC